MWKFFCCRLDEVKDYADKAEALATYARQIEDDEMERTAQRIKAQAVRRAGEILATFQSQGQRTELKEVGLPKSEILPPTTQRQAAEQARISPHQEKYAARIAKTPEDDFEREVERPGKAPTVAKPAIAEMGPQLARRH